jgi:hypothetical protein
MSLHKIQGWIARWDTLPWQHVNLEVYKNMPTLVVAECMYALICFLYLVHAFSHQSKVQKHRHLLLWACSISVGPLFSLLCMCVYELNFFWYGQATVMVTPRFPLYILFESCSILYISTALSWFSGIQSPLISGLLAAIFRFPHDMISSKMLWLTWHDSDNNVDPRIMMVPISSTFGTCIYATCFAYILKHAPLMLNYFCTLTKSKLEKNMEYICTYFAVFILIVPMSLTSMSILQCVIGFTFPPHIEPTSMTTLVVTLSLYICSAVWRGMYNHDPMKRKILLLSYNPTCLVFCLCVYYGVLAYIAIFGKPENHISDGLHQQYGTFDISELDFTGFLERKKYICQEKRMYPNAFDFIENEIPNTGDEWYKIKGIAATPEWRLGVSISLFTSFVLIVLLIASAYHERSFILNHED